MGATLRRTLLTGGVAAALLLGTAPAYAAPVTDYQMPFPCGQEWTGKTRASHSPSSRAIDWNRPDDEGDQVVAAAPGVVTVAEPRGRSGYGNWVRVVHESGENTLYAHLRTVTVAVGQTVDQGALLGTVGSTGNSSGPHLHFEERNTRGVVAPFFDGLRFVFGSTLASRNCVDVPVAGNFLGGPEAEVAVFRRADTATFRIHRPNRQPKVVAFGSATDQPVVGDWDGDGRANPGVRTPGTRTFQLKTRAGVGTILFGAPADLPIAGDWDGDGLWEVGVHKAGTNRFRLRAASGAISTIVLGDTDDLPVTGDWDGDRRTDLGVYDSDTATFTLRVVDGEGLAWTAQVPFGAAGDLPVTGDWDGNGRTDVGVWTPDTAVFAQRRAKSPVAGRVLPATHVPFGTPR
jgi:murein DD-endopeptidase MepM/ murein hydrolase activator NlpD